MDERAFITQNGTEGIEIIDLACHKIPLHRSQIQINFSDNFSNKSDTWIEKSVKLIWDEKCQENNRLYNKSKFRFDSIAICNDHQIVINLGLTTYMELIGTNCHPFGKELVLHGMKCFKNGRSCLADPLGVGCLLLTADEKFLFLKRAMWTGEDKGKLDRPGGHPEPDNVSLAIQSWTEEECRKPENLRRIRDEIFDSVIHEVRDEVNLPMETIKDPVLLGVIRSLERSGRPSAEFLVLCSLTSEEVEELYSKNCQAEADESIGIVFILEEKIRTQVLEQHVWNNLTDAACGAIELYSRCYSVSPNKQ
ncbi:uridine diphosphate glucose pyrophosphatase NUDT22 [Daphnia magna]|uniref:Nucleoside diphosphate-linked moiety X motif n=1 Tax=Daphnia magna TaxID=35525 RepID=A0A0P5ZDC9_9CRUS|nr:uridine diphosphate glucose pyrophosphatase NUDT22 [Daphnia magna]KAK4003540.1 hypothetical protein OUZ56_005299 [Daphnia magna]